MAKRWPVGFWILRLFGNLMANITGQRLGFDCNGINESSSGTTANHRRNDVVPSVFRSDALNPGIAVGTMRDTAMPTSLDLPQQNIDAVEALGELMTDTLFPDDGLDFEFLLQNAFGTGMPAVGDMNMMSSDSRRY